MSRAAVIAAVKGLVQIIKTDQGHRIEVLKTYHAGDFNREIFGKTLPDYKCPAFTIESGRLTINEGAWDIDGASLCPDKIGSFDLAKGYIPHDLGYLELENMGADRSWSEAGWTKEDIRALWDAVFALSLTSEVEKLSPVWRPAANLFVRFCYAVVRVFGGIFHTLTTARLVFILAVSNLAVGFTGGCAAPPDIYKPSDNLIDYKEVPVGRTTVYV